LVAAEAPDREQVGGIPAPPIQGGGRGWWPSVHQRDRCARACKRGSPDREQKGRLCSAGPEKMVPLARDAPRRRHPAMGGLRHAGPSIGCSVTNCVRIGPRGGPPPWTVAFARSWSRGKRGSAPINGCGCSVVTATIATAVAQILQRSLRPRSFHGSGGNPHLYLPVLGMSRYEIRWAIRSDAPTAKVARITVSAPMSNNGTPSA
jgi:hypothetical protein